MNRFLEVAKMYLVEDDVPGGAPPPDAGVAPPMPDMGGAGGSPLAGGAPGSAPPSGDGKSTEISNLKFTYYVALLCELYNTNLEGEDIRKKILLMQKYIGGTGNINSVSKAKWVIDFISRHFISTEVRDGTKDKVKATKDKFVKAREEHKKNPANNIHVITDQFLMELAKAMYTIVVTNANANSMELPEITYGEQKSMAVTFTNANAVFDEIIKNIDSTKVRAGDIE